MLHRKRQEHAPSASRDTSLIASGTLVQGDVRFSGVLHLDGRIEGAVLALDDDAVFTLSEHGLVQGEIRVPHAVINGQVLGDVHISDRLELAAQARIAGDVRYRMLEMAAGAQINGRMTHQVDEIQRQLPATTDLADAVPA